MFNYKGVSLMILICCSFFNPTNSGAVQITESNIDTVLASNEVVFIYFYSELCDVSNMYMSNFNDAAEEVTKAGYDSGKVVMGKVDCEKDANVATRFRIKNLPTFKLIRNGLPAKKQYKGALSVEALTELIKEELTDSIITFSSMQELQELNRNKSHIIGYMDRQDQPEYDTLRKVAANLKGYCIFHAGFGDASKEMHPPGQPIVVFRADTKTSMEPDETFQGNLLNFEELYHWIEQKCIPLVREITFENADELVNEGLPFLILFHNSTDSESVNKYKEIISKELEDEKENINFVTADGLNYEHALKNVFKSVSDLPLIAIDAINHMYIFPEYSDMEKPGKLKEFLHDLYTGELHRRFHYNLDHPTKQKVGTSDIKATTPAATYFKGPALRYYDACRVRI
ncbi:endoplasmic reticulum resident protein 44-like [Vanessa cardui]|uniref:endoplasmic reticulum resident protein 44-like n=1 Tax=Vanessa cardui TaxID=171605 RepID=UPI001F143495|nr:endoplasmic reticulum resident protein 44-like [Vanessa cardui]